MSEAFGDFLAVNRDAGGPGLVYQLTGAPPTGVELGAVLEACAGFRTFPDVLKKAGFLFTPDEQIVFDGKAVKKVLQKNEGAGYAMLEWLIPKFEGLADWSADAIEALIKDICEEQGVGMGSVAQPIRVAITGSTVSPGIGVSLEMLGKGATVLRLRRCVEVRE